MPHLFFEDFKPGDVATFGGLTVSAQDIIAFAKAYDPQPFHLSEEGGRASLLGGLAASGWHTAGLLMRINCEAWLNAAASLGAPGIEELRWTAPVRPGDTLSVTRKILDARTLQSRPGMGVVSFEFDVMNAAGQTMMTQKNPIMIATRDGARPAPGQYDRPPKGEGFTPPPVIAGADFPLSFEEMEPGKQGYLGAWTVTRDDVTDFARQFDPQPFHLGEAAAAASPFGRLAASGWQTAAKWMVFMLAAREASVRAREASGEAAPLSGPSPGFRDLKWVRPVYVGDTAHYFTKVLDRRKTTRPGWGVVTHFNSALNQHGDPVLEFTSSVFTPISGAGA